MKRRRPARDLRIAVDCMPLSARVAMLEGIEGNRIIAGAYTDRDGGICPMLAAHRSGGRTSLASFARAWDRYTSARRARAATARELNTLRAMLEASIALEETAAPEERRRGRRETGERHRARELRYQSGWAWLRPFRRLDEYNRALSELRSLRSGPSPAPRARRSLRSGPSPAPRARLELAVARADEADLRDDARGRGAQ